MNRLASFPSPSRILLACLPAVLLLLAPAAARAKLVDRVVAVVNNDIVKLSELEAVVAPVMQELERAGYPPEKEQEIAYKVREDALQGLIERKLVDQETKRLGVKVDDKDVDAYIEQIKQETHMTGEDMAAALKAQGMTFETFRENQRESLLRARLLEREVASRIVVTQDDIKKYYEDNKDKFSGKVLYHLWHLAVSPLSGSDGEARLDEARTALSQGTSVTEVTARFGKDVPKVEVSDLGDWVITDLAPFFQEKVAALKPGEATGVLATDQGPTVLFLSGVKKGGGKTLEEAAPDIRRAIYNQTLTERYKAWVEALKKKAYIKITR